MISDLPSPQPTRLPGSPLEVVVWQLQFAEPAEVAAARVGQHVSDALATYVGGRPHLARISPPAFTLAVGPGAPAAANIPPDTAGNGWQIKAGNVVATVERGSLSVETAQFEDWTGFRSAVEAVLEGVVASVSELPGEQRLGLRYVDRLLRHEVVRMTDWSQWVEPWLLGPMAHPKIGEAITATAQQIDCDAGGGLRATVRQRAFDDMERRGRPTLLLDFDVFRDGYRSFDVPEVLGATDGLNDVSHRLFRAAITDRLFEALREEPLSP